MASEGEDTRGGMIGEGAPSQARPDNDVEQEGGGPSTALHTSGEGRTFVNPEVESLSPPAAGEIGDYMDDDIASGGAQQGLSPRNNPERGDEYDQGPKTREKNREMTRTGSPDQGTQ